MSLPPTENGPAVRWMSPAAGVWVASRRGDDAGTVERRNGSYQARNARGKVLGSFDDLDSARGAVDGGSDTRGGDPPPGRVVTAVLWGIIGGGPRSPEERDGPGDDEHEDDESAERLESDQDLRARA